MIAALCHLIVRTFFREVVIEGRENLPAAGPVIFTPNHPNALVDPLLLYLLPPAFRIRFVAKAPLFRIPVYGRLLRWAGAFPVVRRLDQAGEIDYSEFFDSCVEALAGGDSIAIFPEGRSLPQPFLAPLRTGPARLFFLARERGVEVRIVPVGLNYERGAVFRSSALIAIAPSVDTEPFEATFHADPVSAVRQLTETIAASLERHVFQAESYRDRELMLLLERLYAEDQSDDSWPQRFARLKELEKGLSSLREVCRQEIDRLRRLLARYQRLSSVFDVDVALHPMPSRRWWLDALASATGMVLAGLGWLLNWPPYRLCGYLVRLTKGNEAGAATYKIFYSLILFPLSYAAEGMLIMLWFGWVGVIAFASLIVPLSYFTLRFFEWREEGAAGYGKSLKWFGATASRRAAEQLARLRNRIIAEVDALAARPELR